MSVEMDDRRRQSVLVVFRCKECLQYFETMEEFNEHFDAFHQLVDNISRSTGENVGPTGPTASKSERDWNKRVDYWGKLGRNEDNWSDHDDDDDKGETELWPDTVLEEGYMSMILSTLSISNTNPPPAGKQMQKPKEKVRSKSSHFVKTAYPSTKNETEGNHHGGTETPSVWFQDDSKMWDKKTSKRIAAQTHNSISCVCCTTMATRSKSVLCHIKSVQTLQEDPNNMGLPNLMEAQEKTSAKLKHPHNKGRKTGPMDENDEKIHRSSSSSGPAQDEPSSKDVYWGGLGRNQDNRSDDEDDAKELGTDEIVDKELVESGILSALSINDASDTDKPEDGKLVQGLPKRQEKRQPEDPNGTPKKSNNTANINGATTSASINAITDWKVRTEAKNDLEVIEVLQDESKKEMGFHCLWCDEKTTEYHAVRQHILTKHVHYLKI